MAVQANFIGIPSWSLCGRERHLFVSSAFAAFAAVMFKSSIFQGLNNFSTRRILCTWYIIAERTKFHSG